VQHPVCGQSDRTDRVGVAVTSKRSVSRRVLVAGVAFALAAGGLVLGQPAGASGRASLAKVKASLERALPYAGMAFGVDNVRGQVLVSVDSTVTGARLDAVQRKVARYDGQVRLTRAPGVFRPLVIGGDAIYGNRYRCSLGFNVTKGTEHYFLTAGHCGKSEAKWWTSSNHSTFLGDTVSATFPGKDYALVKYTSAYTDYPSAAGTVSNDITDATAAFVGENVTRDGSTTGVHSGRVTALNVTVRYQGGGLVRGLIQTTVCAEPGDSGGALYDGHHAVGLTSGGSGDCKKGGTTFFQPVLEALSVYGVSIP
jgi:streptogrisin B